MSKVGNWLLGLQEDAFHCLAMYPDNEAEARCRFLLQHPSDDQVFMDCLLEWAGEHYGEP